MLEALVDEGQLISLYRPHGTSKQFHSEFETALDIERLLSGKFATNDLVLACAVLTYNILRCGQAPAPQDRDARNDVSGGPRRRERPSPRPEIHRPLSAASQFLGRLQPALSVLKAPTLGVERRGLSALREVRSSARFRRLTPRNDARAPFEPARSHQLRTHGFTKSISKNGRERIDA